MSSKHRAATDIHGSPVPDPTLLPAVFRATEDAGGRWLVLRGDASSLDRGRDIDILVEPEVLGRVEANLQKLGFAVVPSAGKGSHRFLLGFDSELSRWMRLDLVTRIDFGVHQELTTDVAQTLLKNRCRSGDSWKLSDSDGFWYLFLHRYLSQRDLKPLELALLAMRADAIGPLPDLIESIGMPHASSAELLGLIQERDWYQLESLRAGFQRRWRRRRPGSFTTRLGYRADRLVNAARSVGTPTGISITIIGPDGAGKTTLAEGLRESLPVPSSYVYMGVWREYPWDKGLRFIPGARLIQRLLRLEFRTLESWFDRVRGRVVLLDRFTYDVMLPSANLDTRGRITAWLIRKICPEPHLVLVLNAPAELMWERKGEQGIIELELRRKSYLEMARTRDYSVVIDAQQSIADVRALAQAAVWERLRRHWNAKD